MPSLAGKRATMRRGRICTRNAALSALTGVLDCEQAGVRLDDKQTVVDYLGAWLTDKALTLKPTTVARYTDYVAKDLVPALGAIRREKLGHLHIAQFIHTQMTVGQGPTTLRRCAATLSSVLNDAVRQRRLLHNPARYAPLPRPPKTQRVCWIPAQAMAFLRYCSDIDDDPLTDRYELIIGT